MQFQNAPLLDIAIGISMQIVRYTHYSYMKILMTVLLFKKRIQPWLHM